MWEYTTLAFTKLLVMDEKRGMVKMLNERGAEGWEVCGVITQDLPAIHTMLLLKRREVR